MTTILKLLAAFISICAMLPTHATEQQGVAADEPASSPSGTEIVFSADYEVETNLWIVGVDGKGLRRLTSNTTTDENPAWSPDGMRIAFSSRNPIQSDIWLINKDGSNLTRLTSNSSNNRQPKWSPDGSKIAFVSDRMGSSNDIWIMNADGSAPRRVTSLPGQENDPSFSPDGSEIVFSHTVDDASLKVVKVDGTGLRTLTSGSARDWSPNWSRYGIVFSAQRSSERSKIWVVQADGTGLRQVGDIPTTEPVWMPDGRILFSHEPRNSAALTAISIFDPKTGTKQVVTTVQGYLTPIDIRPGKTPNRINPKSHGKVSVAILSKAGFDPVTAVNRKTLTFGSKGNEQSFSSCNKKWHDINGDRQPDLVCRFEIPATGIRTGDGMAILRFLGKDGTPYEGRDSITLVTDDDPDDFKADE